MIDGFLVWMLWTLVPIAVPTGTPAWLQHGIFYAWITGQFSGLIACTVYLVLQTIRARPLLQLQVIGWLIIGLFAAFMWTPLQWDAQAVYDRVAHLAIAQRALWLGLERGGNSWILGYPPGASLTVIWGKLLKMPSSNLTHCIVITLWAWNWTIRYISATRIGRSGFLFATLFFYVAAPVGWATPAWHYAVFYNNLLFALIWMQFLFAAWVDVSWRSWEPIGYALVLIWLRPVVGIAALPILSWAAISMLRRGNIRRIAVVAVAGFVVQVAGARAWVAKSHALESIQRAYADEVETEIAARRNATPLTIEVHTDPHHATNTPSSASRVFSEALTWATMVVRTTCGGGMLLLFVLALLAATLGWREGLSYVIAPMNIIALVIGTGFFAIGYRTYRDDYEAFERLLIIAPTLLAAAVTALDARLESNRTQTGDAG